MKVIIFACLFAIAFCSPVIEDETETELEDYTINHKLRTIQEVVAKEGTPGASSPPASAAWSVDKAFNQPGYAYGYHTKDTYGNLPVMIWYHFRKGFTPAEITFRSNSVAAYVPTKYQFVGTNDEHCNQYSAWDILCEDLRGLKITYRYQTQRCVVSDFHTKSYSCLGIRVLGTTLDNTPHVGVGNMRFFKKV